MQVKVILNGSLRSSGCNEQIHELPEGSRVQQLVELLQIEESRICIHVKNKQVVGLDSSLSDGDEVSLFSFVGGG